MKTANTIAEEKRLLRSAIFRQKREFGEEQLNHWSKIILAKLELLPEFQSAKNILFYDALPFEVETRNAILRNSTTKNIFLPVVSGDELLIKPFEGEDRLKEGAFGVQEPMGETIVDYSIIDLVIVPGVAFDKNGKRIGYGKGFYDRLLPQISAKKVGICFDFQLFETIPTLDFDQSVDIILTELQQVP